MNSNESSPNLQIEFHIFKGFSTSSSVLRNGSNPDCIFPRECGKFHSTNCLCRVYYDSVHVPGCTGIGDRIRVGLSWASSYMGCVCGWNGKGLEIKYILRTNLMSHETLYSYIAARDPVRKPRSYKARESYRTAAPINRARLHYIVHSREPQRLPYLVNEIIFCKYRFQQFV